MAAETARGSWISTLLGGTVLATVGFGVGMVAGGLWESPDLVFHYLMGSTEEAVLVVEAMPSRAISPSENVPAVSAGRPVETAAIRPRPKTAKQADLPAVSAKPWRAAVPAPAARIAVQVGAFSESRTAEKLAAGLRAKGYAVYLSPGADSGDARWRVRVGPLASKEEAGRVAARLKVDEKLPTWVLSEDI
jgi:DedD protein